MKLGGVENHILRAKNKFKEVQQTLNAIGSTLFDKAQTTLRQLVKPPLKETSKSSNCDSASEALDEDLTTTTDKN